MRHDCLLVNRSEGLHSSHYHWYCIDASLLVESIVVTGKCILVTDCIRTDTSLGPDFVFPSMCTNDCEM